MSPRPLLRWLLPYSVRRELRRLQRLPAWIAERPTIAHTLLKPEEQTAYRHLLACHASPFRRETGQIPEHLQRGKEHNVARAAYYLNGLSIAPSQTFSYHHAVGRPSRWRGFQMGLELHQGVPAQGIGGGCCQISNTLYLLALRGGMNVTERHRHGLDLFPDHNRTVPFGCGATVFYNYADLRFVNPLPSQVLLRLRTTESHLIGELWTTEDPGWTVEIYETHHRIFQEEEHWIRENHLHRRFLRPDGSLWREEEIAHNRGTLLYDPTEVEPCGEP